MTPPQLGQDQQILHVEGTVDLSVDGVPATVIGRDHALVVRSEQPAALLGGLGLGVGGVPAVAAALSESGLQVVVSGPRGDVLTAGVGVESQLGRWLAGSSQLRLGRPAAVLPLVGQRLRRQVSPHRAGYALAAAAAIAIIIGRRCNRR